MTVHVTGIILAYLIVLAVCFILYLTGLLKVRDPFFFITVLVPFVGAAMLIADAVKGRGLGRKRQMDRNLLMVHTGSYLDVEMPDTDTDRITVPLEEAIILDDRKTRRKLLLDMLQQNRELPMEALDAASLSSDTELSHFATTAMASMQGGFEKEIQEVEDRLKHFPEDKETLNRYWKTLERYLSSGMLSGAILLIYRKKLDACLMRMLDLEKDRIELMYAYEENRLHLLEAGYSGKGSLSWESLRQEIEAMIRQWPDDLMCYRIYMEYARARHDQVLTREILQTIKERKIYMNAAEREWYSFWSGNEEEMNEDKAKEKSKVKQGGRAG